MCPILELSVVRRSKRTYLNMNKVVGHLYNLKSSLCNCTHSGGFTKWPFHKLHLIISNYFLGIWNDAFYHEIILDKEKFQNKVYNVGVSDITFRNERMEHNLSLNVLGATMNLSHPVLHSYVFNYVYTCCREGVTIQVSHTVIVVVFYQKY